MDLYYNLIILGNLPLTVVVQITFRNAYFVSTMYQAWGLKLIISEWIKYYPWYLSLLPCSASFLHYFILMF